MPPHEKAGRVIDLSVPLRDGMVHWPGDPPVRIRKVKEIGGTHSSNLSLLSMGSHTGTHMDAPGHFLKGGLTIDRLPLEAVIGPARVIPIRHPREIRVEELRPHRIRSRERILFKSRNSSRCWKSDAFVRDFVHLTAESARYLAGLRLRCVGVDYLSVGGYKKDGAEVHRALLGAGIWIIEGLNLSAARPGRYELMCLPLKISGGDGAPARAVLRKL
ncbi:MAG: cyclase family protein [Candidatus Omnitrophota bacterium]|nr:cyclase family protein [Candidatus Omnitrophota bacterium]